MLTIYDWFGYELPIEKRYQLIKQAGFDGILLWWSEYLDRNDYHNGPEIIRKMGLYIENIHTPFQVQDYIWLDNLDGETAISCYLQCVADCAEFEIPTMVIHLPDDDKPHNALGLDRFKRIAEKAEQFNINVALENLKNLSNLTYMLSHVDSPRIGFCYDVTHHYCNYPSHDFLSMYSSRLMALHLHDYNKTHGIHLLPFDGIIEWPIVMRKIAETSYIGAIAIEAMNWNYKNISPEDYLKKAFEKAMKLDTLMHTV